MYVRRRHTKFSISGAADRDIVYPTLSDCAFAGLNGCDFWRICEEVENEFEHARKVVLETEADDREAAAIFLRRQSVVADIDCDILTR